MVEAGEEVGEEARGRTVSLNKLDPLVALLPQVKKYLVNHV